MKRVLIVDDAATVRKYERQLIEEMGVETEEAINGIEALEKILEKRFDLLLVDINMPKMNGYELVKEMRRNPDLRKIPVIMISTESGQEDRVKAYEAGANYYIVKPLRPEILRSLLNILFPEV